MNTSDMTPILTYSTISDIVYKWIREAIINCEFEPGQWIAQEDITKRLNVSRTPVRDAFKRLQSEGLLIVEPHKGAMVVRLSLEKLLEIYEIRMLLEGMATWYACEKITDKNILELEKINLKMVASQSDFQQFIGCNRKFHHTLYNFSRREYLVNSIFNLWNLIEPYRLMYFKHEGKTEEAILEHVEIIDALKRRNPDDARQVITEHLNDVISTLANSENTLALMDTIAPQKRRKRNSA